MDLTYIFNIAHEVTNALGVVVVAATALMHALRGLAAVLKKAAELTPTKEDDEALDVADKGLACFADKLTNVAESLKRVALYRK